MSVLHVFSGRVSSGTEGITKNVEGLVSALQSHGEKASLQSHAVDLHKLNKGSTHLDNARRLRQILGSEEAANADIVHAHVNIASMGLAAPRAIPPLASKRPPLLLHVWNALYNPEDQVRGIPFRSRLPHAVANGRLLARAASRRCDALVVSSDFQKRQLEAAHVDAPVFIVPNGIDTNAYRPPNPEEREHARCDLGISNGPMILYYGHLSAWKGTDHLVRAMPLIARDLPSARFVFATTDYGEGQAVLRAKVARRGMTARTTFLGPSNVHTLLAAADLAVFPWTSPVGSACYPNVLLESMAAGVPVVASNVGCVPEIVRPGFTGHLVDAGDHEGIAEAVLAIGQDDATRHTMGEEARRTAEEKLRWTDAAKAMAKIYGEFGSAGSLLSTPSPLPAASGAVPMHIE